MWITIAFLAVFAALLLWQRLRLNRSTARFDPDAEYRPPPAPADQSPQAPPEDGSAP